MSNDLHKLNGPLLLLAGPGTGKTYRLGLRIKFLVEEANVEPDNITVITFTAAAAQNMVDRISNKNKPELFISPDHRPRSIRTMHSLGYNIIRENSEEIGRDCSVVVNTLPLQKMLMEDATQLGGFSREDAQLVIKCRQFGDCTPSDEKKCKICSYYQSILRCCSAVDHDDQILLACQFLETKPDILEKYRLQCKHLLIDEYQDINAAQFRLIRLLCKDQEDGLFVVGDDDQSIYSWRGGSPQFIREFKKYFGEHSEIKVLSESFRCHSNILEGAMSVVKAFDPNRLQKPDFNYDNVDPGPKIKIHSVATEDQEAKIVCQIARRSLPSDDVLILVPDRSYASLISSELKSAHIPFSSPFALPGAGMPLFARLLKWLNNNDDSLAFRECLEAYLNNPKLGIPSKRVRKEEKKKERDAALATVSQLWEPVLNKTVPSLWKAVVQHSGGNKLIQTVTSAFNEILTLYHNADNPSAFLAEATKALSLWASIPELTAEIVAWVQFANASGESSQVKVMTFQGAKGLEARIVCIIGLEDGTMPRADSCGEKLAEEARLFYVSLTRAVKELHLFNARKRSGSLLRRQVYHSGKAPDIKPSRFLVDVPKNYKVEQYHRA